jgi:hypothetical protein
MQVRKASAVEGEPVGLGASRAESLQREIESFRPVDTIVSARERDPGELDKVLRQWISLAS